MNQATRYLLNCQPNVQELRRLRTQATQHLRGKLSETLARQIELCIQEWTVNIVEHAQPTAQYITLDIEYTAENAIISIRDDGGFYTSFAESMANLPDVLDVNSLDNGGMGLFILRQHFPDLIYKRDGEMNLLQLRAPLDGQ